VTTPALQVAIVDDEPLARARLRRLLRKIADKAVNVAFEAADVDELLAGAKQSPVELVFLDIEMPDGDGFSALRRWPGARPEIVFVTAYEEHGVRAFDSRALDYLLKPVSAARLVESLARAREAVLRKRAANDHSARPERISVTIGNRRDLLDIGDIDLVVAKRNYLELHAGKRQYVIRRALHDFHASLRSDEFVRLHRSAVVRRGAIRTITPIGSGRFQLELAGGQEVRTGRNYRAEVLGLR
jgi:two-component system, LytTR family, response regulator